YRSVAHSQTLRPIEVRQTENIRSKRVETNLKFSDAGVTSTRTETNRPKSSSKNFALENLNDLHSALLYLRSQPLRDRSVFRRDDRDRDSIGALRPTRRRDLLISVVAISILWHPLPTHRRFIERPRKNPTWRQFSRQELLAW